MAENEKTIMLVCAAGMSTSMLVRKMLDAAEQTDAHICRISFRCSGSISS